METGQTEGAVTSHGKNVNYFVFIFISSIIKHILTSDKKSTNYLFMKFAQFEE